MKHQEVGWSGMDWTELARARDSWGALEPSGFIQWGEFIEELKIYFRCYTVHVVELLN